jgi:hypothetical protein
MRAGGACPYEFETVDPIQGNSLKAVGLPPEPSEDGAMIRNCPSVLRPRNFGRHNSPVGTCQNVVDVHQGTPSRERGCPSLNASARGAL